MDVKGSDIRKHATAGGSNDTATLHLQLVRGAKAVGKTAALPPTDSLNETTRPDHYRHMRIDGSQELAAHFEKWRSHWKLGATAVNSANIRTTFRESEAFDCPDGSAAFCGRWRKERTSEKDRQILDLPFL